MLQEKSAAGLWRLWLCTCTFGSELQDQTPGMWAYVFLHIDPIQMDRQSQL